MPIHAFASSQDTGEVILERKFTDPADTVSGVLEKLEKYVLSESLNSFGAVQLRAKRVEEITTLTPDPHQIQKTIKWDRVIDLKWRGNTLQR